MEKCSFGAIVLHHALIAVGTTALMAMAPAALADDASQEKDVKAVKEFLTGFGKTWETGPTRVTNKAIEAAYPNQRFYYVFSSLAARRSDKTKSSQVIRLNKDGQVGFASHNDGLMKVGSIEDAKVAAAAIMSLRIGPDGPQSVEAGEVQVSTKDASRVCKAEHHGSVFELVLDRDGKFESMSVMFGSKADGAASDNKRRKPTAQQPAGVKAEKMYYTVSASTNGATVVTLHNTPQGDIACDEIPAIAMAKDAGVMAQKVGDGAVLTIFHRDGKITKVEWDGQTVPAKNESTAEPVPSATQSSDKVTEALKQRHSAIPEGQLDAAILAYTQAIQRDPNNAEAYHNRGIANHKRGNRDKAIADLTEAIRLNPNDAEAFYRRGLAHQQEALSGPPAQRKRNLDKVVADLTEAIRLNSKDAEACCNRGVANNLRGKPNEAIADYTQAIRLAPQDASAYYNRGVVYGRQGKLDQGIADYTEAIRLRPDDRAVYHNRGILYQKKGEKAKAEADFAKAKGE